MKFPIYLDYAATTPIDPRVVEKMLGYLTPDGQFGNPSSLAHRYGHAAKNAIDDAREQVAHFIHAEPSEIIWTSGATESINLALKGSVELYQDKGKHIITLKTEHKAVLDSYQQLEKQGYFVTYLSLEKDGLLDFEKFLAAVRQDTVLVSVMHVNNETGVIQDIKKIAELTASRGILFHVDAAQSVGKVLLDVKDIPVDLVSFGAHKIYGAKGIGALYIRRKPRVRVAPQLHGGGQEQGMRSGTLATHQIVGMGEALHIAQQDMSQDQEKIKNLRTRFWQGISKLNHVYVNGDMNHCVPNILNVRFEGIKAEQLMQALPELAVATGSACDSRGVEPSYVLRAMGLTTEQAAAAIRFSFGRFTTLEEIDFAVQLIIKNRYA